MDINKFKELPILAILRGITSEMVNPIAEICARTGLKALEITMNTKGAGQLIKAMKEASKGRFAVGAGTVLSMDDLKIAINNGASFIVMPTLVEDVMKYCAVRHIPVFPGALTPNEIYQAWKAGATMVKVFPAKYFGPGYMKEVKGPLDEIELLACSGVNKGNIVDYFQNGATAVSVGGSLFDNELMARNEFDQIENDLAEMIQLYNDYKIK